jgi:hypothetical protein
LCTACLLQAGGETLTGVGDGIAPDIALDIDAEAPTVLAPAGRTPAGVQAPDGPRLEPGQTFGPYRLGRLLGRGGMGEVYEAEDVDTGRRLALKILRARLRDADDRARFIYEGRLAASISHPHSVYIYGSEEIDGMPVITMELLPGGTLKDLVAARGPLTPSEAAAAVLDLIGGLDAANAAGILHRDIKPSNCFVDADGQVKVGDFGLSISTLARDAQVATVAGFQGTPQFAAPEQLLGRPLDARADIYAVGATLFYLLTGRPPFEAADLRDLVAQVTTAPPPSPRAQDPRVPARLAAVVMQCLAKAPQDRPATYAALAELLWPFSTTTAEPARPGLRLVAGIIDALVIALPFSVVSATTLRSAESGFRVTTDPPMTLATIVTGFLYYLALEGHWGASIGKRLTGLRVTGVMGAATWRQVAIRSAVFCSVGLPALLAVAVVGSADLVAYLTDHRMVAAAFSVSTPVLTALLFTTVRRSNGWAGVHGLLSGTRVVAGAAVTVRERLATSRGDGMRPAPIEAVRCGPFDIVGDLGETPGGRLLAGFDPVLRRPAWIRAVPAGTPPIGLSRRDLGRAGRLRWLAGRRNATENWDAFEAPDGAPIARVTETPHPWRVVKTWLVDLAGELSASALDGTLPELGANRVWIRADGRGLLLDFPAPGPASRPTPGGADVRRRDAEDIAPLPPVALLADVAARGLSGGEPGAPATSRVTGVPVSVAALLEYWQTHPLAPIADARQALIVAAAGPDEVQRWRRAVPIALATIPMLLVLAALVAALPTFRQMVTSARYEMYMLLTVVEDHETGAPNAKPAEYVDAVRTFLAGRYRRELTDQTSWTNVTVPARFRGLGPVASRVASSRPSVTQADVESAALLLDADLKTMAQSYESQLMPMIRRGSGIMAASLVAISGLFTFGCMIVSSLLSPGGVLTRFLGLAVVDARGVEISRGRAVARVLLAWSPLIVWLATLGTSPVRTMMASPGSPLVPALVVLAVMAAGATWTLTHPTRGPHDWLMRSRVAPR